MHVLKDLKVWHKAMELSVFVYEAFADFSSDETHGLTSQIKRSVISIPSNIAEGAGRNSNKEFKHFLSIAHGSSYELQTQIILSYKLKLISTQTPKKILDKISEIRKMNFLFTKKFKKINP